MAAHFRRLSPLLLLIFIDSLSYFLAIPVLLELFFNQSYGMLAADTSQSTRGILAGFAISLSTLAAIIAAPLLGALSDRWGRKKTLLTCALIMMIGFLLPIIGILEKSLTIILIGRFVTGLGSASQPIAQASVADLCTGYDKGLFLSWIATAMTLPIILGPLAGSYLSDPHLYSGFNLMTPYYCAFVLLVFVFIFILLGFQETNRALKLKHTMPNPLQLVMTLSKTIRTYHIGILLLVFFCLELAWSQYYQSIGLYFRQVITTYTSQENTRYTSLFLTVLGLAMSFGLLFLYPVLIRLINKTKCLWLCFMVIFVSLLACALFHHPVVQWIFAPLMAVFVGIAYVTLLTCISDRVAFTQQGFVMGLTSTILFGAWLITALSSGYLMSVNLYLMFYVVLGVALISLLALYRLKI